MKSYVLRRLLVVFLIGSVSTVFAQAGVPQITSNWKDTSTNEMGFAIERGPAETGPFTEITTVGTNVTTYVDTTVTPAVIYCYRVRAFTERMLNSKTEREYSGYSNVPCGNWVAKPDGTPSDMLLSAQEAIGRAQELLGSATANIARALQHQE